MSSALPTSQLILQPFRCFTYATAHSPTLLSLLLRHRIFTYVTWRATHWKNPKKTFPRKPVPTGDRTRAHCVTDAHATACSTAVDVTILQVFFLYSMLFGSLLTNLMSSLCLHSIYSVNGPIDGILLDQVSEMQHLLESS